ncbi:MAG: IS5 family transposase [Gemmatimonadaceae bacterium]
MRGAERPQSALFSYVSLEDRIPADHPLRVMRTLVDPVLAEMSPRFDAVYASAGRPSIPPEQLLRALLLQVLYTIRSERQLMEQLDYNLLFRWFVGLGVDDAIWVPTVFTKNRDRLLAGNLAEVFLAGVQRQAEMRQLLSHDHFTVDGTLLEAWASHKSLQPIAPADHRDDDDDAGPTLPAVPKHRRKFLAVNDPRRNAEVDFRGVSRSNATHRSVSDPDARLARKGRGKEAKLAYQASVVMDNRYGLIAGTDVRSPSGTAERDAAVEMLSMLEPCARRRTVGADKGYDTCDFVADVRALGFTPHVAQHISSRHPSAIDRRTTRQPGYAISQRIRKRIEEAFGWGKVVGMLRKLKHRGQAKVDWLFTFTNAVYNLVRMRTLIRAGVCAR